MQGYNNVDKESLLLNYCYSYVSDYMPDNGPSPHIINSTRLNVRGVCKQLNGSKATGPDDITHMGHKIMCRPASTHVIVHLPVIPGLWRSPISLEEWTCFHL